MFSLTVCSIIAISRVSGMKLGSRPKNTAAYNKPATGIDELTSARLKKIAKNHGMEVHDALHRWAKNPCYAGLVQMASILPNQLYLAGADPCMRKDRFVQNKFNGCYDLGNVIFSEDKDIHRATPFLDVQWNHRQTKALIRFKMYFANVRAYEFPVDFSKPMEHCHEPVGSFSVCAPNQAGDFCKLYHQPLTYGEYREIVDNEGMKVLFGRVIRLMNVKRKEKKNASMPALNKKEFRKFKRDKRNYVFIHDQPIYDCLGKKCTSADGRDHLHIVPEDAVPMYNESRLVCPKCKQILPFFRDEDNVVFYEAN